MRFVILLAVGITLAFNSAYAFPIHDLDYENSPYKNKTTPSLGNPMDLFYQIHNNESIPANSHVIVTITNMDEQKQVYHNEHTDIISPYETIDIRWNFIPETVGLYLVDITENSGMHSKYFFAVPQNNDQKRISITNPELLDGISPRKQFRMGIDPKLIVCKDGLFLALKTSNLPVCLKIDSLTELRQRELIKAEVIDYEKIGLILSENKFKELLQDKNVEYDEENLLLLTGSSLDSLPPSVGFCGYVLDNTGDDHWFSSSYHFPTFNSKELEYENPHPCKPNSYSCECSLQTILAEKNTESLSYFDEMQQTQVGNIFRDYLNEGGKITNVPNSFTIGKYNLEIDPDLTSFCGQFQGNAYWYFQGKIKDSKVIDFSLDLDKKPLLCAISDDPTVFTFDESAIVKGN